jgi:hypothetical protein
MPCTSAAPARSILKICFTLALLPSPRPFAVAFIHQEFLAVRAP